MVSPGREGASLSFADQARLGANALWRVGLALLLVLGGTFVLTWLAGLAYRALGLEDALILLAIGAPPGTPSLRAALLAFVFLMFSVAVMLPLMRLVLPRLHRRPWRSFVTAKPRFDVTLFMRSFAVMLGLAAVSLVLTLRFAPGELSLSPDWRQVAVFAPIALLCLPFQALAEEIFFRGYLAQLTGRVTRAWPIRLLVPALLFTAAHSVNPEARYDFIWATANYLVLALYLGAISLKSDGLEASFGLHLAVNLYGAVIVGSKVSVSPGPTLWLSDAPDFRAAFFQTLLLLALHAMLVFWLLPRIRLKPAP
jgi:membrane protease YdiL (CAAX protease family)